MRGKALAITKDKTGELKTCRNKTQGNTLETIKQHRIWGKG
jgi:hypothetical protein